MPPWLLRDVLDLHERELLTYEKLQTIGLDYVVVYKIDNDATTLTLRGSVLTNNSRNRQAGRQPWRTLTKIFDQRRICAFLTRSAPLAYTTLVTAILKVWNFEIFRIRESAKV